MRLTVLGNSPSFPSPGNASSGYLVQEASTNLLVDAGHGVLSVLQEVLNPAELDGIIVSHMHADHFFDLVPLCYLYQFVYPQAGPIPLYLPAGGPMVLDLLAASMDLSEEFFERKFELAEYDPRRELVIGDMVVRFARTEHYIETYGMRLSAISDPTKALLYSSDTAWSDSLIDLGRDAALGLFECTLPEYPEGERIHGHLTPELAGKMARQAGIERLLLTHYWHAEAQQLLDAAGIVFGGPAELAEQRKQYEI